MKGSADVRPLHLHTIESLCADLVSGRAVGIGRENRPLVLEPAAARGILDWYRRNRLRWNQNVRREDAEAIVDCAIADAPKTIAPTADAGRSRETRRLRLVRVRAHRFAGIHAYGTPENPPEDFEFGCDGRYTLLEGVNGSGKTSIVNAIMWCLTGLIARAQRAPESALQEFECRIERETAGSDAAFSVHDLTAVTPMPDAYRPSQGQAILVDTWVELTFADDDGEVVTFRREQKRDRGKITEQYDDPRTFGIDPIAVRIGTVMPAMIPHIQLGNASELGRAVSQLTGLSELVDLARHASRVKQRLATDLAKDRRTEIAEADRQFMQAHGDLVSRLQEFPAIQPAESVPEQASIPEIDAKLAALTEHFETSKARALEHARDILGHAFDPADASARGDLEMSIGPARSEILRSSRLASGVRLKGLASLTDQEISRVERMCKEIRRQADVLAELTRNPAIARRTQLYARVSAWIRESSETEVPDNCPVCTSELSNAVDPVTGRAVRQHLADAMKSDTEILAQTITRWSESTTGRLALELPKVLQDEMKLDLPDQPRDLIRQAVAVELFEADCFARSLAPLKALASDLCAQHVLGLPELPRAGFKALPSALRPGCQAVDDALRRIEHALEFGTWRRAHNSAIRCAFENVIGRGAGSDETDRSDGRGGGKTLLDVLELLNRIVAGSAPISSAIEHCGRMSAAVAQRRKLERRLEAYGATSNAIDAIIGLGKLAEQQVDELRRALQSRTTFWRKAVYRKTTTRSHDLVDVAVDPAGKVGIFVGHSGICAPAQHVSNASAMRANLVGFFLAFWEHVVTSRGGLRLLALDDPQELLDDENRDRLAEGLPELVKAGGQLLVTTCDSTFAKQAVAMGCFALEGGVVHRSVFPISSRTGMIDTPLAVEDLRRKRELFEKPENQDKASFARDYVGEVRVFAEARLTLLLDEPAYATPMKPRMFGELLGILRQKVKSKASEFYQSPVVVNFVKHPALAEGSECVRVLNKAHHGEREQIQFTDVQAIKDDLVTIEQGVTDLHFEFRQWCKREPGKAASITAIPVSALTPPQFQVEVLRDLAAFTHGSSGANGRSGTEDQLDGSWFERKALYYLNSDSFGFAAPRGAVAIVELDSGTICDRQLVIALREKEVLARRLLLSSSDPLRVALMAEAPDLRGSRTRTYRIGEIQIHRVAGILLDDHLPIYTTRQEAMQIEDAPSLHRIEAAFRVRDRSAVPLALEGQIVLGGRALTPQDLATHEGRLVAVALEDGTSVFKRISRALPKPLGHVRMFEAVGGLGDSLLIQTEVVEGTSLSLPVMVKARLVTGVLYRDGLSTGR